MHSSILGIPLWLSWQRICLECGRPGFNSWVRKILWGRERQPTPVFWPGEFHGLYSPWGDRAGHDRATFNFMYLLSFYYLFSDYFCSSSLLVSTFVFYFCSWMIFFYSMLMFVSFWFSCIYCRFLLCVYHGFIYVEPKLLQFVLNQQ